MLTLLVGIVALVIAPLLTIFGVIGFWIGGGVGAVIGIIIALVLHAQYQ